MTQMVPVQSTEETHEWVTWADQPDPRQILAEVDPEIYQAIELERHRQTDGIELIASENYVFPAVLAAAGSVLTNKYAEGYPGRRYYGGCQVFSVGALRMRVATTKASTAAKPAATPRR